MTTTKVRDCKKDEILNPKTKRCVKKSGKIGKQILAITNKTDNIRTKHIAAVKDATAHRHPISKYKTRRIEYSISLFQALVRGYLQRIKILPLILYRIKRYLLVQQLELSKCSNDGRISSCIDENIITEMLTNSTEFKNKVKVPKKRWWYDILVRDSYYGWLPVNIKTTTTKTADNTGNLAMCVHAYTNEHVILHPNTSRNKPSTNNGIMSNILVNKLKDKSLNYKSKKDYYFIVVNKTDGDVIVNSVKGLVELTPNLHNIPFQIRWDKNKTFTYGNIKEKVNMFIRCIQKPKPTWEERFLECF